MKVETYKKARELCNKVELLSQYLDTLQETKDCPPNYPRLTLWIENPMKVNKAIPINDFFTIDELILRINNKLTKIRKEFEELED